MSTYKIYKIIDANKSEYSIRLANYKKSVDFKSLTFGSQYADGKLTYGTNDAGIQKEIESLSKFKSGVITIERVVEQEDSEQMVENPTVTPVVVDPVVVNPPVTPVVDEPVIVNPPVTPVVDEPVVVNPPVTPVVVEPVVENLIIDGPTTVQEVKDWLKANKGVDGRQLSNIEKVKAQAEKAGVTFPNVVWPE